MKRCALAKSLNPWSISISPNLLHCIQPLLLRLLQPDNRVYEIQFAIFITQHIITDIRNISYCQIFISIEISILLCQAQLINEIIVNRFLRWYLIHIGYISLLKNNSDL